MFLIFIYVILIIALITIIIRLSKNLIIEKKVIFDDEMNEYILFRTEDNVDEMKELDKIYKKEEIYKNENKSLVEKIKSIFLFYGESI